MGMKKWWSGQFVSCCRGLGQKVGQTGDGSRVQDMAGLGGSSGVDLATHVSIPISWPRPTSEGRKTAGLGSRRPRAQS